MKHIYVLTAAFGLLAACSKMHEEKPEATSEDTMNNEMKGEPEAKIENTAQTGNDIIATASSNPSFTTLVKAIQAAGLVETLQGEGPFTVFAPTDEAFAKLPEGTLETLLNDTEQLSKILTYHVVSGAVDANKVAQMNTATTVQGGELTISTQDGVKVGTAAVTATDIKASNGIIHVIDTVLIPEG